MPSSRIRKSWPVALCLLLTACATAPAPCPPGQIASGSASEAAPEAASAIRALPAVAAPHAMVVTANPLASEAALSILEQGGSAVDAAVAAAMVLNLVEPQSAGLGGGGFMLHFDATDRSITAYEGRETAPAAARPDRFLALDGQPLEFEDAQVNGLSVGVPGLLAMLELAQARHGRLPWSALFEPAIRLARDGFPVSPRLRDLLAEDDLLRQSPTAGPYFYRPDGAPWPVGTLLRNPAFARTLETIAQSGSAPFYRGAIAADIVAAVAGHWRRPGDLAAADLGSYAAHVSAPLCGVYRDWRVCGPPPPSSGGVALLQILGLVEPYDLDGMAPESPEAVHIVTEASRLAFADRAAYLADPRFVPVPVAGLLDGAYLAGRGAAIGKTCSMGKALPGEPLHLEARAAYEQAEPEGTTQVSIVDRFGDAVSLTASIESAFGAHVMVDGFLLNNELTDFAFRPADESGAPIANRVEPGKRPRSSMTPVIVLDDRGRLYAVTGSPGGSSIIGYVAKALLAMLDWDLDPATAAALPNFLNRNGATELEAGTELDRIAPDLAARGEDVRFSEMTSGINSIRVTSDCLVGGGDPRRESLALGD
jgi:gamma-glutamyltranspeptidase / glutathione hydrolase